MSKVGFEPTSPKGQEFLRLSCIPFHHLDDFGRIGRKRKRRVPTPQGCLDPPIFKIGSSPTSDRFHLLVQFFSETFRIEPDSVTDRFVAIDQACGLHLFGEEDRNPPHP